MNKDLFQISQMNDIYFTLDTWAMLSPRLAHEEQLEQKQSKKKGKSTRKRLNKKHIGF